MSRLNSAAVVAMLLAAACSESEPDTEPVGGSGGEGGSAEGGGGAASAGYTSLITGEWALEPFSEKTAEKYLLTLERDIYVGAIRPIAPKGTHHTTLATTYLGAKQNIYAAGLGTNAVEFPPGVGLRLAAGTTLVLELHLFNTGEETLSGTSGVEIVEVAPEDVVHEAGVYFAGPLQLDIPPNEETVATGACTVSAPFTVFAMIPHMHQLGTHLRTSLVSNGAEKVIYDDDFSFDQQFIYPISGMEVQPGDRIDTACTFANTTPETVSWGNSSTDEMCFSVLYRYPVYDDGGFCAQ